MANQEDRHRRRTSRMLGNCGRSRRSGKKWIATIVRNRFAVASSFFKRTRGRRRREGEWGGLVAADWAISMALSSCRRTPGWEGDDHLWSSGRIEGKASGRRCCSGSCDSGLLCVRQGPHCVAGKTRVLTRRSLSRTLTRRVLLHHPQGKRKQQLFPSSLLARHPQLQTHPQPTKSRNNKSSCRMRKQERDTLTLISFVLCSLSLCICVVFSHQVSG